MGQVFVAIALFAALAAHQQPLRPTATVRLNAPRFFVQPGAKPVVIDLKDVPQRLCTMPLLRPDGDVDPKIVVEPPKDVDYKIRVLESPFCIEKPSR